MTRWMTRLALAVALVVPTLAGWPQAAGVWPAPDPGGDELADLRLDRLPDGKLFGYNGQVPDYGPPHIFGAETAEAAAGGGASAMRTSLPWTVVEQAEGVWHEGQWAVFEEVYDSMLGRGITPVFILGWAPDWAREGAFQACGNNPAWCRYPPAAEYDPGWRRYVSEVARRFPRAALEVWNEPNLTPFWRPEIQPERWAELVVSAHEEIKAVNPGQRVVIGGLATPSADRPEAMRADTFLDRAYRHSTSIKGRFDAISFHIYLYGAETADPLAYGSGTYFAEAFRQLRAVTTFHGDAGARLWVSEVGLHAPEGENAVTLAQQADGLSRIVRRVLTMPDADAVLIHRLHDAREGLSERERNWGVTARTPDHFTPKPAYCRFAAMAALQHLHADCVTTPQPEPRTESSSIPGAILPSDVARFELTSNPRARFQCRHNGGRWWDCQASVVLGWLADGSHRFEARAIDPSGNVERKPASTGFEVAATPAPPAIRLADDGSGRGHPIGPGERILTGATRVLLRGPACRCLRMSVRLGSVRAVQRAHAPPPRAPVRRSQSHGRSRPDGERTARTARMGVGRGRCHPSASEHQPAQRAAPAHEPSGCDPLPRPRSVPSTDVRVPAEPASLAAVLEPATPARAQAEAAHGQRARQRSVRQSLAAEADQVQGPVGRRL